MNWPAQDRWAALLRMAGAPRSAPEWYDRLTKAYGEPQRHYHNHQHIAECLAEFDPVRGLTHDVAAVELALWFHDAVYDPRAGNNEEQSADLARQCLQECGVASSVANRVAELILTTKNHQTGNEQDAKIMVDVDLSILGRDKARFFEYEEQIRREYEWVPVSVYAPKRAEILQRFLARGNIFSTDWFHQKYEKQARMNLEDSISRLREMVS
jgi:predicted metal-dependent HD superfamily phosphohydrolase